MEQAHIVRRLEELEVESFWPLIAEQLDLVPHIWEPFWTREYLQRMSCAGGMQVWGCGTSDRLTMVVWTQIVHYPACRALQVVLALGSGIDEALPLLEHELQKFGQITGCEICEVIGRPGWWPKLRGLGFQRRNVTFIRDIGQRSVN